jgi:hypothetical protein
MRQRFVFVITFRFDLGVTEERPMGNDCARAQVSSESSAGPMAHASRESADIRPLKSLLLIGSLG